MYTRYVFVYTVWPDSTGVLCCHIVSALVLTEYTDRTVNVVFEYVLKLQITQIGLRWFMTHAYLVYNANESWSFGQLVLKTVKIHLVFKHAVNPALKYLSYQWSDDEET